MRSLFILEEVLPKALLKRRLW